MHKNRIQTIGTTCYSGKNIIFQEMGQSSPPRKKVEKAEKVNLKFGKVRVSVTNSKRVRVSQDGNTLIILLNE